MQCSVLETTWEIEGLDSNGNSLLIHLNQWRQHAHGQTHLVLQHPTHQFVLILPRQISSPQWFPFSQAYQAILAKRTLFSSFLSTATIYQLTLQSQLNIKQFLNSGNYPSVALPLLHIATCEHLQKLKQYWNCILQFKIKSPFPEQFLREKDIQNDIEKLSVMQRTRWWAKAQCAQSKHLNPIFLFGANVQGVDFTRFICAGQRNVIKQNFNGKVMGILKESNILREILGLQRICRFQPEQLIQLADYIQKTNPLLPKQLLEAVSNISRDLSQNDPFHDSPESSFVDRQEQCCKAEDVLRFLISLTWRDTSVVLRIRNTQLFEEVDIKIIDYGLKQLIKVKTDSAKRKRIYSILTEYARKKGQ